jgi:hypothetical protein
MYVGKHGSTVPWLTNVSSFDQISPVFVSILRLFCNHPLNYISAIFRLSFLHSSTILDPFFDDPLPNLDIVRIDEDVGKDEPSSDFDEDAGMDDAEDDNSVDISFENCITSPVHTDDPVRLRESSPSPSPQKAQQDLAPALVIHGIRDRKKYSFNLQSLSPSLSPFLPPSLHQHP